MKSFLLHNPFYISVFGGLLAWFFIFLMTPVSVVHPMANETICFVVLNVVALVLGYVLFPKKEIKIHPASTKFSHTFLYGIITIIILSFVVRYYDLFFNKSLRISNPINLNKKLAENLSSNLFYIIASVLKQLFFIPLVLCLSNKKEDKWLFYVSISLFFLPFLEGFMRGSRNTFFFSFTFLLLILLYFKQLKFNKKQLAIYGVSIVVLFVIATNLLMKREGKEKNLDVKHLISNAIYSDFLKTNENVATYISEIENSSTQKLAISALQFGQYYTHGIFEFDNVVKHYQKNELTTQKGKYMFFTITRFTNKYKLTNIDSYEVKKVHPRGYTFITLFGGFFLDFGWFSIIIMLFFGALQKYLQNNVSIGRHEFIPLMLFFLFVNFFMYTFNFIMGRGTYIIVGCIFFILAVAFSKKLNK